MSSKWVSADDQWRFNRTERDQIRSDYADVELNEEAQATLEELLRLKTIFIDRKAEAAAQVEAQRQAEATNKNSLQSMGIVESTKRKRNVIWSEAKRCWQ